MLIAKIDKYQGEIVQKRLETDTYRDIKVGAFTRQRLSSTGVLKQAPVNNHIVWEIKLRC